MKSNINCGVTFRLHNLTKQKWYRTIVKNSSIPLFKVQRFKVRRYNRYCVSDYIVHFASRIEYLIGKLSFYLHLAIFLTVNFSSKFNGRIWNYDIWEILYGVESPEFSFFSHRYCWSINSQNLCYNCSAAVFKYWYPIFNEFFIIIWLVISSNIQELQS